MRRILLIIVLCLLAVASTGCKKARLRAQLKELMSSTIVLPEKITCVYNGEVFPMPDSLRDKPKLLVYIDSTECTTCRISHFWEYQEVFDLSARTGTFEIVLLLSDKEFDTIPLIRYLSDLGCPFPLYVDVENLYLKNNPSIPDDFRLHSLLIDNEGKPIFAGDPSHSRQLREVFEVALFSLL